MTRTLNDAQNKGKKNLYFGEIKTHKYFNKVPLILPHA